MDGPKSFWPRFDDSNLSVRSECGLSNIKPNYFRKQSSLSSFLLTIQAQNGHGVLSRLDLFLKSMELACQVLHVHLGLVYLLQVSKNVDEKHCFLE